MPLLADIRDFQPEGISELLHVEKLSVQFALRGQVVTGLDNLSLTISSGEAVGLFGESGSGKTTLALAILGVLPANVVTLRGSIRLHGKELIGRKEQELRQIRGDLVSFIPQEPALALSPVLRVGEQITDVIQAHRPWSRRRCREHAAMCLQSVGFDSDVGRLFASYPHQLSGGQRQRIAIAQAISCEPELLIADEPTTALDPTTQAEILALFCDIRRERGMSLLLISHDPAVLSVTVDRLVVIQHGQVAECGPAENVLEMPAHSSTRSLLDSLPQRFAFS